MLVSTELKTSSLPLDHPVLVLFLFFLFLALALALAPAPALILGQPQDALTLAHSLAVVLAAASPVFHPPALYQARVRTQKHHIELIDLGERAADRESRCHWGWKWAFFSGLVDSKNSLMISGIAKHLGAPTGQYLSMRYATLLRAKGDIIVGTLPIKGDNRCLIGATTMPRSKATSQRTSKCIGCPFDAVLDFQGSKDSRRETQSWFYAPKSMIRRQQLEQDSMLTYQV
ncbi:hypothetical protein V8E54_014723 [Elaphomyces granulatus]